MLEGNKFRRCKYYILHWVNYILAEPDENVRTNQTDRRVLCFFFFIKMTFERGFSLRCLFNLACVCVCLCVCIDSFEVHGNDFPLVTTTLSNNVISFKSLTLRHSPECLFTHIVQNEHFVPIARRQRRWFVGDGAVCALQLHILVQIII